MAPVEITIILHDKIERDGFARFINDLEAYRHERAAAHAVHAPSTGETGPQIIVPESVGPSETDEQVGEVIDAEYATQPRAPEGGEAVVGTITPKVPTAVQMFDALREYVRKNQAPAALALLGKHGLAKITDEMTDEVRVKLYAELTAK